MEIPIIYEDRDIVAVNKPAGVLVHKTGVAFGKNGKKEDDTIVDFLLKHFPEIRLVGDRHTSGGSSIERSGIVHRLDRETSGVIIAARNQESFSDLKTQFQERKVRKSYLALVYGIIEKQGVINKPIGLKPGTIKRSVTAKNMKMIKEAVTEYIPQKHFKAATLLMVTPKTGRTHQIRVHLASIGHPIVGDTLYGFKKQTLCSPRQFLHAESIEFTTLSGKRMKIEAELPDDLKEVLRKIDSKEK